MNKFLVGNQNYSLDLETTPDIKVSGMFKDYYAVLNKRLQYLHQVLQDLGLKDQ